MKWPREIVMIRHGESVYNESKKIREQDPEYQRFKKLYDEGVAHEFRFSPTMLELAKKLNKKYLISTSDADTPLTPHGKQQAYTTGLALLRISTRPDVIIVSPYLRTVQTWEWITAGWPKPVEAKVLYDERIVEQKLGMKELFNDWRFFHVFYPDQAALYHKQGDYNYCNPQGESKDDVRLRARLLLHTLTREFSNEVVWLVTHHLTILCIRSLIERWTPEEFTSIDQSQKPRNCSVTRYVCDPNQGKNGKLVLTSYNAVYY